MIDDERKLAAQLEWQKTEEAKKARQKNRERTFKGYMNCLGLSDKDLEGKDVLDVGAGSLAAFADQARQRGYSSRVVSLDARDFINVSDDKINQGGNKKIGNFDFGKDSLKERLGSAQEPEFDLILSCHSTPYTIVNMGEHIISDGPRKGEEDLDLLRKKIRAVIDTTLKYLKVNGRAVFYPVFGSEIIDFGEGGKRDFRNWRKILDEELESATKSNLEKGYAFYTQNVSIGRSKKDQRLIIIRKF
jgi:hypothetical protein